MFLCYCTTTALVYVLEGFQRLHRDDRAASRARIMFLAPYDEAVFAVRVTAWEVQHVATQFVYGVKRGEADGALRYCRSGFVLRDAQFDGVLDPRGL